MWVVFLDDADIGQSNPIRLAAGQQTIEPGALPREGGVTKLDDQVGCFDHLELSNAWFEAVGRGARGHEYIDPCGVAGNELIDNAGERQNRDGDRRSLLGLLGLSVSPGTTGEEQGARRPQEEADRRETPSVRPYPVPRRENPEHSSI